MKIPKYKPSESQLFRTKWIKKGFELIDITRLCEFRLGESGWCNDINEPEENIYHIQIRYRGDIVANVGEDGMEVIDDNKHIIFGTKKWKSDNTNDFIIFRKVWKHKY